MTSGSSSTGQSGPPDLGGAPPPPDSPEKRKRAVNANVATILAACILAIGTVGGAYIGRATASKTTPTPTASAAAHGPPTLTITPPNKFTIPLINTFSGSAINLQPGQIVWTFNQYVAGKHKLFSKDTYPNSGPCVVDYARQTWTCPNIYIGSVNDNNFYHVCAAILSPSDAFVVVNLLRNTFANRKTHSNLRFWFTSVPPYIHDNSPACMSVQRTNSN